MHYYFLDNGIGVVQICRKRTIPSGLKNKNKKGGFAMKRPKLLSSILVVLPLVAGLAGGAVKE